MIPDGWARARDVCLLVAGAALLTIGLGVTLLRTQPERSFAQSRAHSHSEDWVRRSLSPVPNPDPSARPQPPRCRPYRVVAAPSVGKAYVTLSGKEITPGSEVAVLDIARRTEMDRIRVGSQPYGLALHPSGQWIVVTNRFSNFLSVIDVKTDTVVSEIPILFYCEDLAFSPGGDIAYVSNFWKSQVLVVDLNQEDGRLSGRMRQLGFDTQEFFGTPTGEATSWRICEACGWQDKVSSRCPRCGHAPLERRQVPARTCGPDGVKALLRGRCGTAGCHLYASGGFYAGPQEDDILRSAVAHSFPGDPGRSPLLRTVLSVRHGGWADAVDGRHHPGGVVFEDPETDPDLGVLRNWIAKGVEGPGISVGEKPRDLVVSPDGLTLYVANTGSLDISVVDLRDLRETRRIFTRSPVNDLVWFQDRLVLATLGVGSGHPKTRDAGRETRDRDHPDAEFTLFRDLQTGKPLSLDEQVPLGPYDEVDGTAQEKFRDITNDIVILDPRVENVAAYRADELFTRYTSDSFEALPGDKKGDVPLELMQVVGAFPEQIAKQDDRIYITMSGTFQVQEWRVDPQAEPTRRLVPGRVFPTGFKPTGVDVAGDTLVVADLLGESVTFIDLRSGESERLSLGRLRDAFPATDSEIGEFFAQTSLFSVDQDQSCVHCHYRDTSDGQRWSVSQVMGQSRNGEERTGGSREVPDLRALFQKVPFFLEGTLSIDEPLTMMMEHNPLVDFQGKTPAGDFGGILVLPGEEERYSKSADTITVATGKAWEGKGVRLNALTKRRELHFARVSQEYFGRPYRFREMQKFIGAYQGAEPRLLPNPVDPEDPMVRHGRALFASPGVGCSQCHPAPAFTDKVHPHNGNKSFFPLVTPAARDNVHTLISADRLDAIIGFVRPWDTEDRGRVEEREGFFVAPSLRGLWARPQKFLHHGHAVSLREVLCTPDHPALRRYPFDRRDSNRPGRWERGLNELNGIPDTHGVTSHLSVWDIECLVKFLLSIA